MTLLAPFGRDIVIVSHGPSTPDRYGNAAPGPERRSTLTGCSLDPRSGRSGRSGRSVHGAGRDAEIDMMTVYAPAGSNVDVTDLVEIDGARYEIDGIPAVYQSPHAPGAGGVAFEIRRVVG